MHALNMHIACINPHVTHDVHKMLRVQDDTRAKRFSAQYLKIRHTRATKLLRIKS